MTRTLDDWRRRVTLGTLVGAWLIMVVPMGAAQEVDSRWVPWIGCWRAVDETAAAPVLCVAPLSGEEGIEMLTTLDGEVVSRESFFTDEQQHDVSREECEGWERSEFSDDSRRVYTRSELDCGAGIHRSASGVISMVSPFEWLDVRTVDVNGQGAPWVVRYRLASRADFQAAGQADLVGPQGEETQMARTAAQIPIAPDDVIEAVGKVSAETVQLWIVERGEAFRLDATELIEMADSGVPPSVIDVVVAVSYPEKFMVNERAISERRPAEAQRGDEGSALGYHRSLNAFHDPFYDPYSRYGYGSFYGSSFGYGPGYFGRFGYGYGGYGGRWAYGGGLGYGYGGYGLGYGYRGYGGPIIVVGRRGDDYGPAAGRVVRGGGYSSARGSGGSTGRTARPRSSGSSTNAAPAARSGGSRSSASPRGRSAAPSRGSAGSAGRSTGRQAQPRSGRAR